ncbi:MAG: SDR family oxidoreductase, partial [Fusobacterium periodonticum]|nr:SDR family oxidoreductase [Fusobacterium periodonticum]
MKIFIVGGSSGIGLSLAKRYASLGNRVAICGTNEEKLKKIEESNNNIEVYKVDVRNKEELKSAIDDFSKGNLDLIINSAGIYTNNRTAKLTDKEAYAM